MKNEDHNKWIYYLKPTNHLSKNYFAISNKLNRFGYSLVPITIQDLLVISKKEKKITVLTSIQNQQERVSFIRQLSKFLKLLLRNKEIDLIMLSSFIDLKNILNGSFKHQSNLTFYSYPVYLNDVVLDLLTLDVENQNFESINRTKRSYQGLK